MLNNPFKSGGIASLILYITFTLVGCAGGSGGDDSVVDDSVVDDSVVVGNGPFDLIYVRYPIAEIPDVASPAGRISIPAGETPYSIRPGADLMLLRKDGTETALVDCTECSAMDPFISYDGKTVYYALYDKVINNPYGDEYASWIYKIHLEGHPEFNNYKPIRMTYNDGFDSVQYKANRDASSGTVKDGHDQSKWRAIRDMAPVPLADGRLLFTSNRSALTAFHAGTDAIIKGSVQQLYVMDDHDGTAVTSDLANMRRLETGNIHLVQHPIQLKDGRILFSTWQDAATKFNAGSFQYATTSLFTVHPDGSNLQQFTEPHDHHKNVEHFISQLSDGRVVWGQYYPNLEGFGILLRAPVSSDGPDFLRGSIDQISTGKGDYVSYREFDRKGMVSLTPHTDPGDSPAPNASGKYSMPSAVTNGALLVAYSPGTVNQTDFACSPAGLCQSLKSGIYLIPNAAGDESSFITDPANQLIKIKDDPLYNEIWPRAVLSYQTIHGQAAPDILNNLATSLPEDSRLLPAEANAIVGTSSMYNRQSSNDDKDDPDPFLANQNREVRAGNWDIQGAEAGVFTNDDIYGVRIIATPPKPYTKPISVFSDTDRWNEISRHLFDNRLQYVVARYGSEHGERWEILGEFPVKKLVEDLQKNPDTSWLAKIPADTPFFIQTIDNKGMTLISEITWRALKSGEKRADCGGCHAHSIAPLDIATTEAGKGKPIEGIVGVNSADPEVKDGIWDLTLNSIPLLNATGVTFKPGYSYGVEFNRDIVPILNDRCVSCHQSGQTGDMFILNNDPWSVISESDDWGISGSFQISRYIRTPQARQSLLVWVAWGERLDGRTNDTRADDIDYPAHPTIPGITDEEKRTIARWVDLGSPINFSQTDGMGYTDDYQLPVVNIYTPHLGDNTGSQLKVGFADAKSGIDKTTLSVKYFKIDAAIISQLPDPSTVVDDAAITKLKQAIVNAEKTVAIDVVRDIDAKNVLTIDLGLSAGEYVITVSVNDKTGNTGIASRRFIIN